MIIYNHAINSPFPLELNTLFQKQAKYESYENCFSFAFCKWNSFLQGKFCIWPHFESKGFLNLDYILAWWLAIVLSRRLTYLWNKIPYKCYDYYVLKCRVLAVCLVRDCESRSPRTVAVVRVKSCSCFFMTFKFTTTGHLVPRRSPFIVHLTSVVIGLPSRGLGRDGIKRGLKQLHRAPSRADVRSHLYDPSAIQPLAAREEKLASLGKWLNEICT